MSKLTKLEATRFGRLVDAWLDTRFERRREFNRRAVLKRAKDADAQGEDSERLFYPQIMRDFTLKEAQTHG